MSNLLFEDVPSQDQLNALGGFTIVDKHCLPTGPIEMELRRLGRAQYVVPSTVSTSTYYYLYLLDLLLRLCRSMLAHSRNM